MSQALFWFQNESDAGAYMDAIGALVALCTSWSSGAISYQLLTSEVSGTRVTSTVQVSGRPDLTSSLVFVRSSNVVSVGHVDDTSQSLADYYLGSLVPLITDSAARLAADYPALG